MTKPSHFFYTLFRNLPYTDEQWARANDHRAKLRGTVRHPERYPHLEHRPVHSFVHGPTCYSHKEARKACEAAIERGAQMVEYVIWGPSGGEKEVWKLRKGGHWYEQKKNVKKAL